MDISTVITKVLEIIATPVGLILGALAAVWVQLIQVNGHKLVAAKLGIGQDALTQAKQICQLSVSAAQQLYKAEKIADRKAYALEMAKQMRDDNKVPVTDEIISHLIESQVWDTISGPALIATTLAATTAPAAIETPATEAPTIPPGTPVPETLPIRG